MSRGGSDAIRFREVIPAMVVVMAILAWTAYGKVNQSDRYQLTADLPRAVAVYEGNAVVVDGYTVGTVDDVVLDGDQVRLTLGIRDDFPIPVDADLEVVPSALLGERVVRLSPMWQAGEPRMEPGTHLDRSRTAIPVELDEALDVISSVLDDLDGETVARLVDVGATELEGRGQVLNDAVAELADLTRTLSESDHSIDRIVESADVLTAALASKGSELGTLLDTFATASGVLAAERDQIVALLEAVGTVSEEGTALLVEHDAALRADLQRLERVGRALATNADILPGLLNGVTGFFQAAYGAYRPSNRSVVARFALTPELVEQLEPLLVFLGVRPCIPLDVKCEGTPLVGQGSDPLGGDTIIDPDQGTIGGLDLLPDLAPRQGGGG